MSVWAQDPATPILHATGFAGVSAAVAGVFGWIPVAATVSAAIIASVSYSLTIMDNPRVKLWATKRKQRRTTGKITRLRAQARIVQAQLEALERMVEVKAQTEANVAAVTESAKESLKS